MKKNGLTEPLRVRLYPSQAKELAALAAKKGVTTSEMIRSLIDDAAIEAGALATNGTTVTRKEPT